MALDDPLSPSQRSKIRRLSAPKEPAPGDEAGELNVVPYLDIVTNLMMFVLATVSIAFVTTVEVQPALANPKIGPVPSKALRLTAIVTSEGVALTTAAGHVAPGCAATPPRVGAGLTVPKLAGGDPDLRALSACARAIKAANPAFAEETQFTLTASGDVPYEVVIAVTDALRLDADGPLFPDVAFGALR